MPGPALQELGRPGRALTLAVPLVAVAATAFAGLLLPAPTAQPVLLAALAVLCLAAGLVQPTGPGASSLPVAAVPLLAAGVLLPAWALPALAGLAAVPRVLLGRAHLHRAALDAGTAVLAALAAAAVAHRAGLGPEPVAGTAQAAGLLGAGVAFGVVAAVLRAVAGRLLERRALPRGGEDRASAAAIDLALVATGAVLAALWLQSRPLALLALGPMVLVHRALLVPALRHKSRTDPKTGLFHLVHFEHELADALRLARRRDEPLAVLMVDLDDLRGVNNRFGHLAGDRAIREVGGVLLAAAGARGIAARFGGEEFCLMLPGAEPEEARRTAERVRQDVRRASWVQDGEPVELAVSIGVAACPQHGTDGPALLRAADAALYDAKLSGRDRVRLAPAERRQASFGLAVPSADPAPAPAAPEARVLEREAAPPVAGTARPASARLVPWYVGALLAGGAAVALLSDRGPLAQAPGLLLLLVLAVLVLDSVRIDVFAKATTSPASVPTLALAFVFGPAGPVAAELAIAAVRAVRREEARIRWTFDLGALTLAGGAAGAVFALRPGDGPVGVLAGGLVAALAYYVVNMALIVVVMALSEGVRPSWAFRERLAWLGPHYAVFGLVAAATVLVEREIGPAAVGLLMLPAGVHWLAQKQYVERSRASVEQLRAGHEELQRTNRELERLLADKRELLGRMQHAYLSTITSLARTIEAKDPYTGGHTERVARVAVQLARDLDLHDDQLRAVEVGAVIHDIGKVGVADAVLLKPGRLDAAEFAQMRRHPEISSYIIGELELPAIVRQMVRGHHERFDGRGYPDGLAGEEIPLAARILAVADTLDAMTSDRPYRRALAVEDAIAEVREQRERQFCPRVVDALLARLDRDPTLGGMLPAPEPPPLVELA